MSEEAKFKPQGWRSRFPQQYIALLKKNALVAWRNKFSTLLRILAPCIFIVLVLLLDFAVRADTNSSEQFKELRNPGRNAIEGIPECETDIFIRAPCFDFVYSPNNDSNIETIVENIRLNNPGREIATDRVKGFGSLEEANVWLLENPEMTGAGVHFESPDPTTIDFTLQLNSTIKFFRGKVQNPVDFIGMPLQVAAHRETTRLLASGAGEELSLFDIGWKIFAHPVNFQESLIGSFMGIFLFVASMFSFVMTMTSVIGERETKVTQALQTMGMMRSSYWLSWITWEIMLSFVIVMIAIAFGAACQINFFIKNAFGNVFFTLFTFQLAMVGFAYFVASFIRKTSTAISLGFAIFLVGFVFQLVVNFNIPYSEDYYTKWGSILTIIFSAMPWCPFAKAINDLGDATLQDSSDGLSWANRYSYCNEDSDCRMALPLTWGVLLIEFFGYTLLAVYLSAVLPDASGVREPPHFFLMPSFWQPRKFRATDVRRDQQVAPEPATMDDDVAAEQTKMRERLESGATALTRNSDEAAGGGPPVSSDAPAIEMYGIQRRFGGGKKEFWAIVNSWLEIPNNQLFCLLGPNGAGKSTTINILTGVLPPSGGDAVMVGESIRTPGGMDEIRTNMGVCPQFDILWHELTAREHMVLFGNIKGLATSELVADEADKLLREVNLTYAAQQRAGSFSGGMKRRLSVACALLGDPKLVFLDEPTTGMDPVSRRQVWDIIERAKQGRAIILTTHSMEEADILGDRIAIMARGNLRCLGTSLRLKQKFGAGYQVAVSVAKEEDNTVASAQSRATKVKAFIKDTYGFEPLSESSAYMTYLISRSDEERLPAMLKSLESNTGALEISDIQIALTTLEEVFLNIAKQAEIENAQGKNIVVQAEVDGKMLPVNVGQELVTDPTTNKSYKLMWGQDHNGELCVSEVVLHHDAPVV